MIFESFMLISILGITLENHISPNPDTPTIKTTLSAADLTNIHDALKDGLRSIFWGLCQDPETSSCNDENMNQIPFALYINKIAPDNEMRNKLFMRDVNGSVISLRDPRKCVPCLIVGETLKAFLIASTIPANPPIYCNNTTIEECRATFSAYLSNLFSSFSKHHCILQNSCGKNILPTASETPTVENDISNVETGAKNPIFPNAESLQLFLGFQPRWVRFNKLIDVQDLIDFPYGS